MISIVIPVYNEESAIERTLKALPFGEGVEVIIVDSQSDDKTMDIVKKYPVKIVTSPRGRAMQMNAGARIASGSILLFLHADCRIDNGGVLAIKEGIAKGYVGGCFTHKIDSPYFMFRLIELTGNIRSKVFGLFYGDQAIFVRRDIFEKVHGYPNFLIFEDAVFTKKMKRMGRVTVLNAKAYVSPRRWEKYGIMKTTLLNWALTIGFMMGVSTDRLAKLYKNIR